jgi:hypothetical protein
MLPSARASVTTLPRAACPQLALVSVLAAPLELQHGTGDERGLSMSIRSLELQQSRTGFMLPPHVRFVQGESICLGHRGSRRRRFYEGAAIQGTAQSSLRWIYRVPPFCGPGNNKECLAGPAHTTFLRIGYGHRNHNTIISVFVRVGFLRCQSPLYINRGKATSLSHRVFRLALAFLYPLPH